MNVERNSKRVPGNSLNGQVAVVTGGSSGIGRATAVSLAREGARVVIIGTDETHLEESIAAVSRASANKALPLGLILDVGCEKDVKEMARRTIDHFGTIDILVNSAGIARSKDSRGQLPYTLAQLPLVEWEAMIRTNLRGTFLSNRAVLPVMISKNSGTILNIASSPGGIRGQPFAAAYCATKFAVLGLSESLAEEVGQLGIRVNALFPDLIQTPLLRNSQLEQRLGPALEVDRIANHILYLLALPKDVAIVTSRRLGHGILRSIPTNSSQWVR
jgi:NAD(P)-dependent dehydrogenase (short-subunit alcohol dehydrogenase family)